MGGLLTPLLHRAAGHVRGHHEEDFSWRGSTRRFPTGHSEIARSAPAPRDWRTGPRLLRVTGGQGRTCRLPTEWPRLQPSMMRNQLDNVFVSLRETSVAPRGPMIFGSRTLEKAGSLDRFFSEVLEPTELLLGGISRPQI